MEISTGFALIALVISFWSVYTAKRLWFLEHRPIISAEIVINTSGVGTALLDLVVYNSGNRPATQIYLEAEQEHIEEIISLVAEKEQIEEIKEVFSVHSNIPLLLNGESTKTAFFSFSNNSPSEDILLCNSSLPIKIYYSDITGKKYNSNLVVSIKDKKGFGGSVWA